MNRPLSECILTAVVLIAGAVQAGEWPQILGPDRTGIAAEEPVAERWPEDGPDIVWSKAVGEGDAGIAVAGGTGILFHRLGDEEVVQAFDAATGGILWQESYPTTFASQVGQHDGPLCVPTIIGGRVITFGPQGVLSSWSLADGTLQWRRNTHEDFDALEGYFGAGSSPLVEDERVIVNVGGAKAGAGIVAFDLETGADLWKATDERPSYSAPTSAAVDGQRVILCLARLNCVALDPKSGDVLWEIPCGRTGATVNAATPVVLGDHVFLTSSYGVGAIYARMSGKAVRELWRKTDVLTSQYTTPIANDGVLFGIDGRDDIGPAHLRCIDAESGGVLWSEDEFGYATLIRAGDRLIIIKTDGELVLARANQARFEPLSRHQLTNGTLRALPALSGGRLFVRDEKTLFCLDIGQR